MSVFSDVPSPFPLIVSLKTRPLTYRLQIDSAERIATLVLCAFWGLGTPFVLYLAADPFSPWPAGDVSLGRAAAFASLLAFLFIGLPFWLWPAIRSALARIDVQITERDIEVVERGPLGERRWSKPISDYMGVAIENWGTRTVGNDKIPVSAVMLVHHDERYSLPLHIDGALNVKERIAKGKAEHLGLPLIEAPRSGVGVEAHGPGTIVVNRGQALKVRILYAVLGIGGLATAVAAFAGYASMGDALFIVLAALGLVLAVAIHVYARCYVTAMKGTAKGFEIVTAVPLVGRHEIARADVVEVAYREGRGGAGTAQRTHTPWVKIRVAGARLPFIVDMQSDFVDEQALIELGRRPRGCED